MDRKGKNGKISVSHVNVRESVSFLVLKLIVLDLASAVIILVIFSPILLLISPEFFLFPIILFLLFMVAKLGLSIWLIVQWLNEYYEITPEKIIHRWGFFWRKEEDCLMQHMTVAGFKQGVIGKLLNYGTIKLYDEKDKKNYYLYLIHNPMRYYRIIKSLLPKYDEEKDTIREHFVEEQD